MPGDRTSSGHALGIDFGTSHTVAVVRWPDGRARPLLIDGSPLLPSAVYAEPSGALTVGRDAIYSARVDPARFEPNPKRRVDDGMLLLGDREVPVVELVAAVFGRVTEEWARTVGQARPEVTLTCPATWGATRRRMLADAAGQAGFDRVRLVAEPVAAATYFANVLGRDVPIGSAVVVHDFGAGTFDASVVARTSTGFEVLAVDGRDDIGGVDVDAAIIAQLKEQYGDRDPGAWARLDTPTTVEDRRAKRQLWDDVRAAKERLSRSPTADLVIPLLDVEAHLTRGELETLAAPILDQTVKVTQGVISWANLAPGRLAGVFLVGGSSRIPLMATLLHRALGEAPEAIEQPELVVAEGSILAGETLLASAPPAPGPTMQFPRPVSPAPPVPAPVSPPFGSGPPVARAAAPVAVSSTPAPASPPASAPAPASAPTPVSASAPAPASAQALASAPAPAPASAPGTAQAKSVGRVAMPGARRLGGPRAGTQSPPPAGARNLAPARGQHGQPLAATRPMERIDEGAPAPARRSAAGNRPAPAVANRPAPAAARRPVKRRPGPLFRLVRAVSILVTLIVVPVVAGVIAFSVVRETPPEQTVRDLLDYLARLTTS